jgi:DDE family transposase
MTTVMDLAMTLQTLFTTEAEQVAEATEAIQRVRCFTAAQWAQTLVFGWLNDPQATLDDLAATAASCGVTVTSQAIDQRFTPATARFLHQLLNTAVRKVVAARPVAIPLLQRFPAVTVQDSTTITLPDALASDWPGCGGCTDADGRAAIKFQVRLDLNSGHLDHLMPQSGRVPDQGSYADTASMPPGSLHLTDLGYFDLDVFQRLEKQEQYWLSRLLPGTAVFAEDGRRLALAQWLPQQKSKRFEISVELGIGQRVPCRLLVERVPPAIVRKRRERIRKDARRRGVPVSAEKLMLAKWTVYVTNAPPWLLKLAEVLVLARIRWQIELIFKLWKEQGRVDEWRTENPWRILAEIFAKLLGVLVQHWILLVTQWSKPDRSLCKAASKVRRQAISLAHALASLDQIRAVLNLIAVCLSKTSRINKSRRKPRTYMLLLNGTVKAGGLT